MAHQRFRPPGGMMMNGEGAKLYMAGEWFDIAIVNVEISQDSSPAHDFGSGRSMDIGGMISTRIETTLVNCGPDTVTRLQHALTGTTKPPDPMQSPVVNPNCVTCMGHGVVVVEHRQAANVSRALKEGQEYDERQDMVITRQVRLCPECAQQQPPPPPMPTGHPFMGNTHTQVDMDEIREMDDPETVTDLRTDRPRVEQRPRARRVVPSKRT